MEGLFDMLKYFWVKFLLTIPTAYFIFTDKYFLIVYMLIMMCILDTLLGIWVALKYKIFISHRLSRIASKVGRYFFAMIAMYIVSISCDIFSWVFEYFGIFLILTELFSNLEKLSLLGLQLPTRLLAKFNKYFYDYYLGDEKTKRKALKNILNKKTANQREFRKVF